MSEDKKEMGGMNRHEPIKKLLIMDDYGGCLYGRNALERIAKTGRAERLYKVCGISAEAFIMYLAATFGEVTEVQEVFINMGQGQIDYDLLAAISEKVQLSLDDLEQIRELHFTGKIQ
jgi:hypothetical protein